MWSVAVGGVAKFSIASNSAPPSTSASVIEVVRSKFIDRVPAFAGTRTGAKTMGAAGTCASCFRRAAFEWEHASRAALDEQDQHDQHGDLAKHRACHRLEKLVDDAESESTHHGAPKIADTAEHHNHE